MHLLDMIYLSYPMRPPICLAAPELQQHIRFAQPVCLQVFGAYCQRKGLVVGDCRFMHDGALLAGDVTPEEVCSLLL